ncbi:MAG: TetR/AcrR family transcriptional regulator [Mycobacterium sp.]|uniref:TetR/AcrR family transcriptional regulator n=1 Tax=Mycobacterium sp. TaxID=1785 RepID=UPI0026066150|nr:TetR/AcrR family transcriptional regulator [Mycobacterium sp.]MDI3313939.1 TetR/AcrR family transcriptional regulator [Mycobacterium sp.]
MPRPRGHGRNFHKKKNEIVDLAAKLFAERGYAATNLDDLAAAARLGKGALYYYINSKEDLLVEIQSRVVLPVQLIANEINELGLDPVLRLRILSEAILTLMFQRLPHIWAREHDSRHLTGKNLEQSHRERRLFEKSVCRIMDEAISSGIFRPIEPRLAMLQFLNLHIYTYRWINPEGDWTPCYLSQEYCTTFFRGMWSEESEYDPAGLETRLAAFLEGEPAAIVRNALGSTHLGDADRNH